MSKLAAAPAFENTLCSSHNPGLQETRPSGQTVRELKLICTPHPAKAADVWELLLPDYLSYKAPAWLLLAHSACVPPQGTVIRWTSNPAHQCSSSPCCGAAHDGAGCSSTAALRHCRKLDHRCSPPSARRLMPWYPRNNQPYLHLRRVHPATPRWRDAPVRPATS